MTSTHEWTNSITKEIGGCDEVISRIVSKIHTLRLHATEGRKLSCLPRSKGVLVYGKPGTGKTALALAVASKIFNNVTITKRTLNVKEEHSQLPYFVMNGSDVFQAEEGASEMKLKSLFDDAKKHKLSLLVLDEIDMLTARGRKDAVDARISSTLLSLLDEMNGPHATNFIFIIGLSSRLHAIDPCFLNSGRLDHHEELLIKLADQRYAILAILTQRLPFESEMKRADIIERVSKVTHGFVPSDLQSLCAHIILQLVKEEKNVAVTDLKKPILVHWYHFEHGLKTIRPSNLSEYATKIPSFTFSDIYGMENIIDEIKASVIHPFHHPEQYRRLGIAPPRGILLHGPPGVGKTMLCCALASEAGVNFMLVESSQVRSKVVGESEKNIAKLFSQARANSPCILFIDQIDMLLPRRGTSSTSENTNDRIVTGFLTEMDGLLTKTLSNTHIDVLVVAATNRMETIDPAVLRPGRFDERIHVPLPDEEMPIELNDKDRLQLAHGTVNWSGAEMDNLFREAAMVSLRENVYTKTITMAHIETAKSRR
ncbi:hypothetical protein EC973_009691 [Apophysomyces ossiformis]|uniref:AAA+ ATPase domain-containing protein n=1 Tax=Apophysomyces ossiformis TaxID=679940 RepID=A0A8H7BNS4_9FUNG|nr:hypothetical protein EC973_009691 [Apophysomyces ossiformis]